MSQNRKYDFQPKIIGILTADNIQDSDAWKALASCDMVEFRGDFWPEHQVLCALKKFRADCLTTLGRQIDTLFTLRLVKDGGKWPDLLASTREKIWLEMEFDKNSADCEWVDLELEAVSTFSSQMKNRLQNRKIKILASQHNFSGSFSTPGLVQMGLDLSSTNFDGVKLAVNCQSQLEVLELLEFAKSLGSLEKNACVLSMGDIGRATRVLTPILGCNWTYGYLSGTAVAPGQLSVNQIKAFFSKAHSSDLKEKRELMDLLLWAEGKLSKLVQNA